MLASWVKTLYNGHFCLFLLLYSFFNLRDRGKQLPSTPQETCSQATINLIAGSGPFFKGGVSLLFAYGKSRITWERHLFKDRSRASLLALAKSIHYNVNYVWHIRLFVPVEAFAASHSRGIKPPCWREKVALGQDNKGINNFKWWFPLFVFSQCDFCSPAWRFCNTWLASC